MAGIGVQLEQAHEIKAIPLRRNPKLGPDQFNRDDFIIDHTARTATCPAGITVTISPKGAATFGAKCRGCHLRSRCTSATDGRWRVKVLAKSGP